MQHPKDFINKGNIGGHYDDEDLVDIGVQFLQEQSVLQFHCRDKQRGSNLLCSCLSIFRKEEEAWEYPLAEMVARYMVFFARLSKPEQQRTVIDWIRYSLGNSGARKTDSEMRFLLPIIANEDELDETDDDCVQFKSARDLAMGYHVCYSAMLTIVGYSWRFWRRCKSAACSGVLPVHGLTNRRSNHRISLEGEIELQCFFDEMAALAEPLPTRFVREITGELTTRDTNTELKQLASSFSKRGLYSAFSYEQGWAISSTAKGTIIKTSRSDELWEASGRQHAPLISGRSFNRFWNKYFPWLIIRRPSTDVCGECYKFYNRMKYKAGGGDATEAAGVAVTQCITVSSDIKASEGAIDEAKRHVVNARVMRETANARVNEALQDEEKNVSWGERHDCIVVDYCQNMELPFFGGTQPGDTYYFSPLGVYCFGVCNVGTKDKDLTAYIYPEGDGKKGGNNVASLLIKDLERRGWIQSLGSSNTPRARLTIILDSCGGQNKNRMVLRLAMLLVEIGAYKAVDYCFLVAGHTKNTCDRMFNSLKVVYRRSDVFTMDQMVTVLGKCAKVYPVVVGPSDFKDFDALEDRLYKRLAAGTVNRSHMITALDSHKGQLRLSDTSNGSSTALWQDLRRGTADQRATILSKIGEGLIQLERPGVPAIKQCELYNKYRAFVPAPYQDTICPYPGEDILNGERQRRNDKRKAIEVMKTEERAKIPRQGGRSMTDEMPAPQGDPAKTTAGSPPHASI